MSSPLIQFDSITKRFAGVTALSEVSLSIGIGECHGLMGENGAGKSTLGKILAGIYRPDEGKIFIDGTQREFSTPKDALRAGIGMVHQELAFCPHLCVAENLCMGRYPRRFGLLDRRAMCRQAEELLARIGVTSIDVSQQMDRLSTAQEQLVQIASAVGTDAKIIIFDEPTSSLSEPEAQQLFLLIESLKKKGVTTIYVSHRMPELFRLCDRISVLRDGKYVGTLDRAEANQDAIVRMMIGRSVDKYFPQHLSSTPGRVMLEVEHLNSPGVFEDISFTVRAGEIVGLAGLVGAGRSEIARAIFGLDRSAHGKIKVDGQSLKLRSTRRAMRLGVGMLPEDRKRQGLVLNMCGRENISLAMLGRVSRGGVLSFGRERRIARDYFSKLRVKAPSIETPVVSMSGGNQQKVALAKWLARGAKLLIVDEPTRGVDIGAKAAMHQLIDELAREGVGVLLISSELPEVMNLSSRVLVMRGGRIVGTLTREQADQEAILRLMTGADSTKTAITAI